MADEKNNNSHDEPNPEEPQSATTTATTTNGNATNTTNGNATNITNGNATNTANDFYTSSDPASEVYIASREQQQQPNPPRALPATPSDIRRYVFQLGNHFRAMRRYFGEDITRYGSLQNAELFRQTIAVYAEVAHGILREVDKFEEGSDENEDEIEDESETDGREVNGSERRQEEDGERQP
ncbi:hypothetical protein N0V85_006600 [Neurospora sp. IMI 360204]|nr:hypothetical protein N0V85_006600 [Neurospora sp. IMI 360204]